MTFECRCPGCGGRFRAADEAAGRRVACPKCGAAIQLPGPSKPAPPSPSPPEPKQVSASPKATPPEAAWFVRTADDNQHGPMTKGQLDQLVAQGRLDAFCELRRADWGAWREIEEVYPSLALDDDADEALGNENIESSGSSAASQTSRVRPCPDCQQIVSRRAVQCPHCGCPLIEADAAQPSAQPSPQQSPPGPSRVRYSGTSRQARDDQGRFAADTEQTTGGPTYVQRRRARRIAFLVFSIVLLIAVIIAGIFIGIQIHNRSVAAKTPVAPIPAKPKETPPPEPPAAKKNTPLTAEQVAECKEKVAAAMAREVDNAQRVKHDTMRAIPQLGEYARALEMAQDMLDPKKANRRQEKDDSKQSPKPDEPYQSQYAELLDDCLDYLNKHVTEPVEREETIWNAGNDWVKMRLPERQMLENLLRPPTTPDETRKQP